MRPAIPTLVLLLCCLGGCAHLANTGPDRRSSQTSAERATPPTRTSDDELDGPTAPRGSAYRPIEEEQDDDVPYQDEDN